MEVVGLISGGKDSCYNMMHCMELGHKIVALGHIRPFVAEEIDSFMYQSVGSEAVEVIAEAIGVPLYQITTKGVTEKTELFYDETANDEVEDLYELLVLVLSKHPGVKGVSSGAIWSNYQRLRVENVCSRLGLVSLAFLWHIDQRRLLRDILNSGIDAVIVKIGSLGLSPDKHLAKHLSEVEKDLLRLGGECGLNVCGEGGEFETLTLDAPIFKRKVVIDKSETVIASKDPYSPVAYVKISKLHLEDKVFEYFPKPPIPSLLHNPQVEHSGEISLCHVAPVKLIADTIPGDLGPLTNACFSEKYFCLSSVAYSKPDGLEGGVKSMMQQIGTILHQNQLDYSHVIQTNLLLTDINNYNNVNKIYSNYFKLKPPSRVCLQTPSNSNTICRLQLIGTRAEKTCMHIQSRSYWAPANIGPYAQCHTGGNWVFVAGQIGLIPSTMELADPQLQPQLALQHCETVMRANNSCVLLTVTGTCYGTDKNILEQSSYVFSKLYPAINHIVYVVVPKLPRNATCEWHLTSLTNEFTGLAKKDFFVIEDITLKSFVTVISSTTEGVGLTIHVCQQQQNEELFFDLFEKEFHSLLVKIKSKYLLQDKSISVFRAWSVLRHSNVEDLLSGCVRRVWDGHQLNVCIHETENILFTQSCILVLQVLTLY